MSSPRGIDPRGPQVAAALTAAVLAIVLLVAPHPAGVALLALQTALFAVGATRGVTRTPHAWLFRTLVRPRLAPPAELEDPAPPRFAQGVGLVFSVVALAAYVVGLTFVGQVAAGLALVAALLNAVFGLCLGCELYLAGSRLRSTSRGSTSRGSTSRTRSTTESIA